MTAYHLKNIVILYNPVATGSRAADCAEKITKALVEKNIDHALFSKHWPTDFNNFTDIFIVGGDGTLNYFINHYPGIQLPLVIFNGGTGNDFHWLLYGNKSFQQQLETALNETPKPIDIGKCNDHYFINGVGIGFEGEVAKALTGRQKLSGKKSFFITILKKIISYRSKNYVIHSGEFSFKGKKFLVNVSNGSRAGGGFHVAPEAKADDGLFDIVIVDALNPLKRLRYLPVIKKGNHLQLPFIHYFHSQKIIIESNGLIQYHLDGEYAEAPKLAIEILPAALQFRF